MVNEVCEWEPTFLHLSLLPSTMVMPVSNGSILIIATYVQVLRCHPEERRISYSRHSFEWIGVKECIYIQWEEFHSFSIEHHKSFISSHFHDRGWHGQSNHCTTVADLNYAKHQTPDSSCISLQGHRQLRILIARNHPILVLEDSFSLPPAHTTHQYI